MIVTPSKLREGFNAVAENKFTEWLVGFIGD
jgi:hypothetical protein